MSLEQTGTGHLVMDPIERSNRGESYLAFTMVVPVPLDDTVNPDSESSVVLWFDCTVKGRLMLKASTLRKGDLVSARGHATLRRYKHRNTTRESYQIEVNELQKII